jgi:hypothetical protein
MGRVRQNGSSLAALLLGIGLAVAAPGPSHAAETATGTIKSYECGDNCYLTVARSGADDLTGLCSAKECEPWNEVAEMPADMVGRKVTVTVEMGQQLDADGNVMGEFPSFTKIAFEQ